jgi:hypothetical protein
VWHVDRLFRQPRDLERLIDLADAGFRVISSHGSRDLSNPDDRYIPRIEVAHAARSSMTPRGGSSDATRCSGSGAAPPVAAPGSGFRAVTQPAAGWVSISARDAGSNASARLPGHHAQVGIALGAVALVGLVPA